MIWWECGSDWNMKMQRFSVRMLLNAQVTLRPLTPNLSSSHYLTHPSYLPCCCGFQTLKWWSVRTEGRRIDDLFLLIVDTFLIKKIHIANCKVGYSHKQPMKRSPVNLLNSTQAVFLGQCNTTLKAKICGSILLLTLSLPSKPPHLLLP